MKNLMPVIFAVTAFSQPLLACEFTSLKASVKVESRTLDYNSHKEKIKTVGSTKGAFIKGDNTDYKVFKVGKTSHALTGLSISESYDYYTTKVNTNVSLSGDVMIRILREAIGEKKVAKNPALKAYLDLINPASNIGLTSRFYAFHGSYYGETDDETKDGFELVDPANKDNKLIVTVDFKRKTKCN